MIPAEVHRVLMILPLINVLAFSGAEGAQEESKPARLKAHRPAITGVHGLVTSGHSLASMAGVRVLMDGGNAADAAVAVLATLNLFVKLRVGNKGLTAT